VIQEGHRRISRDRALGLNRGYLDGRPGRINTQTKSEDSGVRVRSRIAAGIASLLLVGCVNASAADSTATVTATSTATGLRVSTPAGVLWIEPWSRQIIHVRFAATATWTNPYNSWVVGAPAKVAWTLEERSDGWLLKTGLLAVQVRRHDGALSFLDSDGAVLLREGERAREIPIQGSGPVVQSFDTSTPIYGLGQHQNGLLDYSGATIHLQQANRDVAVPMMVSPRGFGVLWNNASVTDVDVGQSAAAAPLVIRSEAGGGVDYDFIYGPELDEVVAGYRQLTGDAPLMPRWMWGLWQSRERYASQKELLEVGGRYRELGIPLDVIVQDWQYWEGGQWGSHRFDPARYPDPKEMVAALHAEHLHVAISVWPRFDLSTPTLVEFDRAGAAFPKTYPNVYPAGEGRWYDPFSPAGREIYWSQIDRNLGSLGFDAWWLDASEAELGGHWGEMRDVSTAAGPGRDVYNSYPLLHTTAVYQGARQGKNGYRPVILTRSAFAGQQRNAAITWSGDTRGDWETFRRQIPAALNFSLSGIPYWSADIGGFFGGDPKNPDYAELFTRWYEFAVFNPMFRVHGTGPGKEPWAFPPKIQQILLSYDQLRYRLLPYIYSASWDVTHNRATLMRALAMDFRKDPHALEINDEYMFGRALLVSPVVQATATVRTVYLPAGTEWYEFGTGVRRPGGQVLAVKADLAQIPLYVRAGSILPMGPVKPYADAHSDEPMEIRVYPGREGEFELYDDEGDGLGYEQGHYSTVRFTWHDDRRELEIGARQGQFPGMRIKQSLRIVCGAATAESTETAYVGKAAVVKLPQCRSEATDR
jgi:alpha-D-xyloside xylohydrolase